MFVDSHCHLDKIDTDKLGTDLATIVKNAERKGVRHMLCVCVTLDQFRPMAAAVEPFDNVSLSCGLHPLYVKDEKTPADDFYKTLVELGADPRVIAVGETGLDYFYDPDSKAIQQQAFAKHIAAANTLKKPLIIHTRDAQQDTLAILKEGKAEKCKGVLHCFTESLEMAQQAIDELDFYVSLSGILSFRNAEELRATAKALPLERLLIETDSPWLAPVPHRGKQNQPAYVADVAKCLAEVKGVSIEEVAEVTTNNFNELFKQHV
ncbi:metal-dependent hydrolase [Idiomarina tyrosinivorans]|uniref:Metal-dependent hydrolase n=1 Tax=Idiomarina tyrosinivorans TaxID=1445662 RepID=A0A432ZU56_9GAMM|nr:TatD family hydrolase [Idiomarina tyrosinivorans]RUO81348.1 metal-dependent hydrolase [Idiomarina tyrosinivorans]